MLVDRAYKFRMYPSVKQEELINKTIGCSRLVYNIMLSKKKENFKLTSFDMIKEIPKLYNEYPFLKEVDSCSLRCAIFDLENGLNKYYKKQGGYPKYKKKGIKDSYRTNCIKKIYKDKIYENIKIDLKNKIITLPKLKEVKIRGYRNLECINGRIINATIEHIANKYYVSLCVEEEMPNVKTNTASVIGIDMGIKSLITTSEGISYGNPNYLKKYERKIKGLQKGLSRKIKGSNNYNKYKIKLQETYRKLQNARRKTNEEIVSRIIKDNDIIVTEDLNINSMIKEAKKSLRRNIINSTMSDIIRRLKYKCQWLNKKLIQVNRYYASSQICSSCGNKNKIMKDIKIREYKCPKCGIEIERDINASINIMYEGIISYYKERYQN